MAGKLKKAKALELVLAQAPMILGRLWCLAAGVGEPDDQAGAHTYDELHGGTAPLLPLLREYAEQLGAIDDALEYQHAEPIDAGTFIAESWHGVVAQWCGRVAGYVDTGSNGVRQHLRDGKTAKATLDEANRMFQSGATFRVIVPRTVPRAWAREFKADLRWFAGHVREALDGMLLDGKKLKVGLDKERRRRTEEVARTQEAGSDVPGNAILNHLRLNQPASTSALLQAVTGVNARASKRAGEAALRRLRDEKLIDSAPGTKRGVFVLTARGRQLAEERQGQFDGSE